MGHRENLIGTLFVAALVAVVAVSSPAVAGPFLAGKYSAPSPKAAQDICDRYHWACSYSGDVSSLSQQDLQVIKAVNQQINLRTRSVADRAQYSEVEHWALPTKRGGDCEDFALLKKRELIYRGIAPERLLIATVLDRQKNGHAVLVVRTDEGDVVLDNLTDRIKPWAETKYTFLLMQDPKSPSDWVGVLQGG